MSDVELLPGVPPSPREANRRGLRTVVLVLVALSSGVLGFLALASLKPTPTRRELPAPSFNVEVYRIERRDLREMIPAFGTVRSDREVVLAARVAGEIVEVHQRLKVGQRVHTGPSEGQKTDLVLIDRRVYEKRVDQAERRLAEDSAQFAQLDQDARNTERLLVKARSDHSAYKQEYERVRKLFDQEVASQSDLTRALLELGKYEDQLIAHENAKKLYPLKRQLLREQEKTHRADRDLAQLDLSWTRVRPPFDGVLGEVHVELGQYVRVGEPLLRLIDDRQVEIPLALNLSDFERVRQELDKGERPLVELSRTETDREARWTGVLVRMAPEADQLTRTALAYVIVENPPPDASAASSAVPLLPGAFVHARIKGPVLKGALVIPRDAILGNDHVLVVVERAGEAGTSAVETRPVRVLRTLDGLALVDAMLADGELVLLTNLDRLSHGARAASREGKTAPRVRVQDDRIRTLDDVLADQQTGLLERHAVVKAADTVHPGVN